MKNGLQKFGKFLSGMVMPNIGAFIAWGFITAFFIEKGWIPNEKLAGLVTPMLNYLLPVLVAYQGGKLVGGDRGGVMGGIAVVGVIVGAPDYPMLMGAMLMGPIGGFVIKKFDKAMEGHMPAGFEMLINNFSVGIFGMILAIIGSYLIGPLMAAILVVLSSGVDVLVNHGLLPLAAIFVEPAKVLFLNNAINHGIFTPIATLQAQEAGKSIMYMLEANPGPGLGVLLAYWAFSKDKATKDSAPVIIHFLGGIHEIYFPYVLMNPVVIIAPIIGNICAITFYSIMKAGLVGPSSPGSIIAFMSMSPKGSGMIITFLGVVIAAAVSFLVASPIIKMSGAKSLEEAQAKKDSMKAEAKGGAPAAALTGADVKAADIKKIIFACDAGMGSSAMGATMLRNKLKDAGITGIEVIHHPVSEIPGDCQIVVTHHELSGRAAQRAPQARIIPIHNFMGAPEYDALVNELLAARKGSAAPAAPVEAPKAEEAAPAQGDTLLERKNIVLGCAPVTPEEAIKACGKLMVASGYVDEAYIQGMLDREASFSVAIGSHVAIPHGTNDVKPLIKRTGVVVMTYPEGIDWNGDKVKLVVGIAAKGEEHLEVLGRIVAIASTDEDTDKLVASADAEKLFKNLNGIN